VQNSSNLKKKVIIMNAIVQYFRDSYKELTHRVTWPSWTSLELTAVNVILATIALSLILFSMDKILLMILDFIY
jgi:preprotein translocase subunit SecE